MSRVYRLEGEGGDLGVVAESREELLQWLKTAVLEDGDKIIVEEVD